MIRDQFVEGCVSGRLRNRLCAEDHLILQRLEPLALAEDRGVDRQRLFGGGGGASRQDHSASPAEPVEVAFAARKKTPKPVGHNTKSIGKCCYACGRTGHFSTELCVPLRERSAASTVRLGTLQ